MGKISFLNSLSILHSSPKRYKECKGSDRKTRKRLCLLTEKSIGDDLSSSQVKPFFVNLPGIANLLLVACSVVLLFYLKVTGRSVHVNIHLVRCDSHCLV